MSTRKKKKCIKGHIIPCSTLGLSPISLPVTVIVHFKERRSTQPLSMAFDWTDIPGDDFCSAEYISSVLFPVQSQFNAHCSCPYDDDLSSYSSFSISLCSTGAFIPPFRFVSMSSINYSRAQLGPLCPANTFSNQRPLQENSRSLYWVNIF